MKSYLNRLFTGYSIEKRESGGLRLLFKFKGKLVYFDPVLMIQECQFRKLDSNAEILELQTFEPGIFNLFPQVFPDSKPSVICEFEKENQKWTVSRYALKQANKPVSHYRFEINGQFFGALFRIYDNGNLMMDYALKIGSAHGATPSLSKEKIIWNSKSGEEIFIEKFGHTQIWIWIRPLEEENLAPY